MIRRPTTFTSESDKLRFLIHYWLDSWITYFFSISLLFLYFLSLVEQSLLLIIRTEVRKPSCSIYFCGRSYQQTNYISFFHVIDENLRRYLFSLHKEFHFHSDGKLTISLRYPFAVRFNLLVIHCCEIILLLETFYVVNFLEQILFLFSFALNPWNNIFPFILLMWRWKINSTTWKSFKALA